MSIGNRSTPIKILAKSKTQGAGGRGVVSYPIIADREMASVRTKHHAPVQVSERTVYPTTVLFETAFVAAFLMADRIEANGTLYKVRSVDDPDMKGRRIEFKTTEITT